MKRFLRSLPALALLFFTRLLAGQEAEKAQETPPAPPEARLQDEPPAWAASLEEAVERARGMRDGRILVELREPRCPECEQMEKLVYPSASFRAFTRDKVPVSLLRGTPEGDKVFLRYGVRLSPAWLVLTPDLLLCGKQEGETSQHLWVKKFIDTEVEWAEFLKKLEAEKKSPSDPAKVMAVAEEAYRRYGDQLAAPRFRRVADDRKAPRDLRDRSLAYLASIALSEKRLDDAERDLRTLLEETKDPALREKAELRLVDVEVGRGERRKAAVRLESFLSKYPESPLRPQAEALLEVLRAPNP